MEHYNNVCWWGATKAYMYLELFKGNALKPNTTTTTNTNNNNSNNNNNNRTSGDYPNNTIIENDQNTEKSPGHLRRLTVTQTPVKSRPANGRVKNLERRKMIIYTIFDFFLCMLI